MISCCNIEAATVDIVFSLKILCNYNNNQYWQNLLQEFIETMKFEKSISPKTYKITGIIVKCKANFRSSAIKTIHKSLKKGIMGAKELHSPGLSPSPPTTLSLWISCETSSHCITEVLRIPGINWSTRQYLKTAILFTLHPASKTPLFSFTYECGNMLALHSYWSIRLTKVQAMRDEAFACLWQPVTR